MNCLHCKCPTHPDTAVPLSEKAVLCAGCGRHFLKWMCGHMRPRGRGPSFYDAAVTSIRPDDTPRTFSFPTRP